jgi:hypothetical protein
MVLPGAYTQNISVRKLPAPARRKPDPIYDSSICGIKIFDIDLLCILVYPYVPSTDADILYNLIRLSSVPPQYNSLTGNSVATMPPSSISLTDSLCSCADALSSRLCCVSRVVQSSSEPSTVVSPGISSARLTCSNTSTFCFLGLLFSSSSAYRSSEHSTPSCPRRSSSAADSFLFIST